MGLFEVVDWEAMLDRSRVTRTMDDERRSSLNCINARQIAVVEHVEFVLCGGISTSSEGLVVEAAVFEVMSGGMIQLRSATLSDREAVVRHVLAELRRWRLEDPGRESPD
jgi:hypothetical protein